MISIEQASERFARATEAWRIAAAAMRRNDVETIANQFAPDVDDKEAYLHIISLGIVGAAMCAQEIHRHTPSDICDHDPPCGVFYSLEAVAPEAWNNRNQVCAVQAVTCAANGDLHMVSDLMLAHIPPRGIKETGVLLELLDIYLGLADAHGDNHT